MYGKLSDATPGVPRSSCQDFGMQTSVACLKHDTPLRKLVSACSNSHQWINLVKLISECVHFPYIRLKKAYKVFTELEIVAALNTNSIVSCMLHNGTGKTELVHKWNSKRSNVQHFSCARVHTLSEHSWQRPSQILPATEGWKAGLFITCCMYYKRHYKKLVQQAWKHQQ